MPRRNSRRPRRTKPKAGDLAEKEPTLDEIALQLVKAGRASVHVLGPLHPRVHIPNQQTTDKEDEAR